MVQSVPKGQSVPRTGKAMGGRSLPTSKCEIEGRISTHYTRSICRRIDAGDSVHAIPSIWQTGGNYCPALRLKDRPTICIHRLHEDTVRNHGEELHARIRSGGRSWRWESRDCAETYV